METRFKGALERDQDESGQVESMDETLSEAGEKMVVRFGEPVLMATGMDE